VREWEGHSADLFRCQHTGAGARHCQSSTAGVGTVATLVEDEAVAERWGAMHDIGATRA
jgi:hypothetical protein